MDQALELPLSGSFQSSAIRRGEDLPESFPPSPLEVGVLGLPGVEVRHSSDTFVDGLRVPLVPHATHGVCGRDGVIPARAHRGVEAVGPGVGQPLERAAVFGPAKVTPLSG